MGKRAIKKRRNELRQLLEDRREALGELVLGMHVQGIWDDGLLARGAAEVKEVEDGLTALDAPDQQDGSAPEAEEGPSATPAAPGAEAETKQAATEAPEDEEADTGRGLWRRRKGRKAGSDGKAEVVAADGPSAHPEFETAEHTAEHRLPPEEVTQAPPVAQDTESSSTGSADVVEAELTPPPEPESEPARPVEEEAARKAPAAEPEGTGNEESPLPPPTPRPTPAPGVGGDVPVAATEPTPSATGETESSPLDALERRLEQEERTARSGVETARASVQADSGTEVASLLETLTRDREGLEQALSAASARLSDADRRAGEAAERASRIEVENREAAAKWVREQAAEIEADAAVAAEIAEARPPAGPVDETRVRELEAQVQGLRSELEGERREKTRAIETAEVRVREIEARAVEIEAVKGDDSGSGPSAAELREAAVGWLRGQIVALRREMEAAEKKGGRES